MAPIQENKSILGFDSFGEFFESLLGLKKPLVNATLACFATITSFITDYIWDDANAVYFLVGLIGIDALTGIWKSYKFKTFRSKKLPRILVIAIIYVVMLGISWNAAKFSGLFTWLPGLVYGGLVGTQLVSIYENFAELGYLPKGILYDIKKKLGRNKDEKKKED